MATTDALHQLIRVTRSITGVVDRDELLQLILNAAVEVTGAERGFLILLEGDERLHPRQRLRVGASHQLEPSEIDSETFQASRTAILKALGSGTQHHDPDAMADPEHSPSVELFGLRSILCEILKVRDRHIGVLYLDSRITSRFSEGHREILPAFASQAAICIEQACLVGEREESLRREHERNLNLREMEAWKEAMTAFVSIASHDLKGPLAALRSGLAVLKRLPLPEPGPGVVEDMEKSLRRASRLVEMYLDASLLQQGGQLDLRLQDLELRPLAERELQLASGYLSEDRRQLFRFENRVPAGLMVRADADRLRQILGNLIQNAVKYSPRGATVEVGAELRDTEVSVLVSDTGPGIEPLVQEKVFQRYYRGSRDGGGTGIGLWIVKQLVESHGGSVSLESEPGKGTTFRCSLPRGETQTQMAG